MFIKVAVILFLYLIRLRFPQSKSLSQIIKRRFGKKIIKRLRKFKKIDCRLRNAELDLDFLVKCRDNNVLVKFLNFHLANRSLRFFLGYAHCQFSLLFEEIRPKKSNFRVLRKEFDSLRSSLQQQINSNDYDLISGKFLKICDLELKSNTVVQQKKFCKVLKEKRSTLDPGRIIFNFSKCVISDCEKSLLTKGLNFSIACKKLDYANYVGQFELFFIDICNLNMLPNEHYLSKNKDFIIQKSDKGNSLVIGQRQDYLKKMNDILSDQKKLSKVSFKDDTLLNFAITQEKHVDKVFKKLVKFKSMTGKIRKLLNQ